jgi:hypothetical protein
VILGTLLAAALSVPKIEADVGTILASPSPAALLSTAADAAELFPHGRPVALALGVLSVMARFPSLDPIRDAQLHMSRSGRRLL